MKKTIKTANNLRMKDKFYIVEEAPLFPGSDIMKSDVCASQVRQLAFGEDNNEEELLINNTHTVKFAGKLSYKVGDIIFDEEIAAEVWGKHVEDNLKLAKKALEVAKKEKEGMENLKKVMETTVAKTDLGFTEGSNTKIILQVGEEI